MEPRIMVHGSQGKLSNPLTVNKVRSALFAGIRAAFLWHQLGGRRWQLMLHRRSIQAIARRLS
jgi:high frequency lysogenization protein